jgi:hypothetical protein
MENSWRKPVVNTTVERQKVPPKPIVKSNVGPKSVKSDKVTKKVTFANNVQKPTEKPKSQIRILKRSEQSWSPIGTPGASTSKANEKKETVLNNQKKIDQKVVENVNENVTLKPDVPRPKTQAWVPRKN